MKFLVLCTGNTCRSQMAEGFIKSFHPDYEVFSAGTKPGAKVNPFAVQVMMEEGIDISGNYPKNVNLFLSEDWDVVATVCDNANAYCPVFPGNVKKRLHIGFDDPANATGTDEEILNVYRRIRDEIKNVLLNFHFNNKK